MKKKRFFIATLLVVAVIMVAVVSCKKEENARLNNDVAQMEQNMSPIERQVIDFLADHDAMERGVKTEGEAFCPEDARRLWETTLNYCYSFSYGLLSSMRMDTVRVTMPKTNGEGYLDYGDVLKTYSNIVDAVREKYKAINMDGKTLQFVMMSIENGTDRDGDDEVVILMNTGSNNLSGIGGTTTPPYPWYRGPFVEGDDWIWGMNKGKCDGSVTIGDAVQKLTEAIAHYDMSLWADAVPCYGCQPYFIIDPTLEEEYYGNIDSIWPFYDQYLTLDEIETYCIPWEDMNMYYEKILQATHTENMVINPFGVYGYYKTVVYDFREIDLSSFLWKIWHGVWVYYAEIGWRAPGEYPVPIGGDE